MEASGPGQCAEIERGIPDVGETDAHRSGGLPDVQSAKRFGWRGGDADFANHVVRAVCDVKIARGVYCGAVRIAEFGGGSRSQITQGAGYSVARDRGNIPVCSQHTDALVGCVVDVKIAGGVDGNTKWAVEFRTCRDASVSSEASRSGSGHGRDDAVCIHFADAIRAKVGDVEIAHGVECHATGMSQGRGDRRATVADGVGRRAANRAAGAGHGRDDAGRAYLADGVVKRVHDVEIARRVEGHAVWCIEGRGRCWAAISQDVGCSGAVCAAGRG